MEGDLAAAIATVEDSRQTHVIWRNFWLTNECKSCAACEDMKNTAGDQEHHEACIDGYNNVLEVLYSIREENNG